MCVCVCLHILDVHPSLQQQQRRRRKRSREDKEEEEEEEEEDALPQRQLRRSGMQPSQRTSAETHTFVRVFGGLVSLPLSQIDRHAQLLHCIALH